MKKNVSILVFLLIVTLPTMIFASNLMIEFAPVFAEAGTGANATVGNYFTVFNGSFSIGPPASGRIDTNTGIYTPTYAPAGAFFYNDLNYWIKTQTGVFDGAVNPAINQMVIQLEGSNTPDPTAAGQGGMFDIINAGIQYAADQTNPPGKVYYQTQVRIGAYDVPFSSGPTVLTSSRLQSHDLTNTLTYDPSSQTLTLGWGNVNDDNNGPPIVHSLFDANGLDIWFDFRGSSYAFASGLEDQGVRLVTFFNGQFPGAGGNGNGGGTTVPEPATMLLLGSGLIGLFGLRRKFKK